MAELTNRQYQKLYRDAGFDGDLSSKWYASPKSLTLQCDGCNLLQEAEVDLPEGRQLRSWCTYGVGKVLSETPNPRRCALLDKNGQPRDFPPRKRVVVSLSINTR